MERDVWLWVAHAEPAYFNSHAHVERDVFSSICDVAAIISTHTLTWSVTVAGAEFTITANISTHTLTWSVTDINGND